MTSLRQGTARLTDSTDVAVIGAGIIGISVAYALFATHGLRDIVLIDPGDPMALTSAQSGENYRNWWPHPVMTAFTDHAISLLEDISRATRDRIHMTRRGYVLATRHSTLDGLVAALHRGYGEAAGTRIRIHKPGGQATYQPAATSAWDDAPDGVDVLLDRAAIRSHFPSLSPDVAAIVHIRRAGDISGQQLGQFMLEAMRAGGVRLRRAKVVGIERDARFRLTLDAPGGRSVLAADRVVDAAGPAFGAVAAMLGETLPVSSVYQQKLAFEDRTGALPRGLPFTIDLDEQELPWTDEEREILASDPATARLLMPMPGGVHRRPEGGTGSSWIKLGWAYNATPTDPEAEAPADPNFPDVVLRAASRLTPALSGYLGRLPRGARHYGGYYTMTRENWPLIGPMRTPGAFMAGALSGYGTMAATATGSLCAGWIMGAGQPGYALGFTLDRYEDAALMAELQAGSTGML